MTNCGLGHFVTGIDVGYVAIDDRGVATLFFDLCQCDLGVLLVSVDQQDLGPLAGEQQGNGLADADEFAAAGGACAGHNGHLAF